MPIAAIAIGIGIAGVWQYAPTYWRIEALIRIAREKGTRCMSQSVVLVELTRAGVRESVHRGWVAVARASGALVASAGDPERVTFARSAMKPFQAVALVESGAVERFGFGDAELAVACASHNGEDRHRAVVAGMLERVGLPASALRAGDDAQHDEPPVAWEPEQQLAQNCSGKHAGMLAACVARGYATGDYDDFDHPHQRAIREIVSRFWRVPVGDLIPGRDMCTLPAYAAPLRSIATGWAAIADPSKAPPQHQAAITRLVDAMAAEPFLVAGTQRLNTQLMEVTRGRILAKDGAEGVLCMALREQELGVAIKVEDGSFRGHDAIALALLRRFDALRPDEDARLAELWPEAIRDNRWQHVGDMRAVFELDVA
jgi:L-asparaginase II